MLPLSHRILGFRLSNSYLPITHSNIRTATILVEITLRSEKKQECSVLSADGKIIGHISAETVIDALAEVDTK